MGDIVRQVFEELNYPSVAILTRVLKKRGIDFDPKEVASVVSGEQVRQVQKPAYQFTGKIAAKDLNARLFADLIDFTAAPSDGGKRVGLKPTKDDERYVLVVQRVFDRKLWTKALTNKRPETVAEAFKDILKSIGGDVGSITTDRGAEFGEPFRRLMESENIAIHTKAKFGMNDIATIDAAIGSFKKALARVARRRKTDDWASILAEVTRGQNNIPKEDYLEGAAPNDVENDGELRAKLRKKNQDFMIVNREAAERRAEELRAAGQFRIMLDSGGRFTRGFKPKWSERVYKLDRVDGAFVFDTEGNEYLTKFTQPVSGNAEQLQSRRIEQGGSALFDARRIRVLEALAREVKDWMGNRTVTLAQVGQFVSNRNFRTLALEARLNMKAPVANFLRAFPDLFDVTTNKDGRSSVKSLNITPPALPGRRLRKKTRIS